MDASLEDTINLVRLAQKGDDEAVESLFTRYLPRVRQIVSFRMGFRMRDFASYEDLVQDALLHVFKNLDRFEQRSESSFRNWISTCVVNAMKNQVRDERAKKRGGGKVRPLSSFQSEDLSTILFQGKDPTPSDLYGRKELLERIEGALLDLKEHYREVILLRLFCEMSHREVADALGLRSEPTVRKMFSRAMDELRERL